MVTLQPQTKFDGKQFIGRLLISLREAKEYNLYTRLTSCINATLENGVVGLQFDNDSAVEYVKTKLEDIVKLTGMDVKVIKVDKKVDPIDELIQKLIDTFGKKVIIK